MGILLLERRELAKKRADVMTGAQNPKKQSKAELERLVKSHGGRIVQNDSRPETICIGHQSMTASVHLGNRHY